jgi:hypothetical protein
MDDWKRKYPQVVGACLRLYRIKPFFPPLPLLAFLGSSDWMDGEGGELGPVRIQSQIFVRKEFWVLLALVHEQICRVSWRLPLHVTIKISSSDARNF